MIIEGRSLSFEPGADTCGESLPVQKEGALRKRSAMLSHCLAMCSPRLSRLSAQYRKLLHFRRPQPFGGSVYHVKNEGYWLEVFMMRYFKQILSMYFLKKFNKKLISNYFTEKKVSLNCCARAFGAALIGVTSLMNAPIKESITVMLSYLVFPVMMSLASFSRRS